MTKTAHTPEQLAILAAARDTSAHLIIDAKAGSGKTTTLIDMLPLLRGTTSLQAFNRSIADELKTRVSALGVFVAANVQVSTVHSHGLQAIKRSGLKPQTQGGKLSFILRDELKTRRSDDPLHQNTRHVSRLASMAKNAGFGLVDKTGKERFADITDRDAWLDLVTHFNLDVELEGDYEIDDLMADAQDLLLASNANLRMIDFDDMIYLPLLRDMLIPRYKNVLIDEAQDINSTRRELAFRSLEEDGRLIAVGDPHQAIYGFTGASVDSLNDIRKRLPASVTLPLSICWRCDEAIIADAQTQVPGIKARPGAGTGKVASIAFRQVPTTTENSHGLGSVHAGSDFLAMPRPGDAILCRLNKPLVATCLGLLRRGQPARIEGRDIGKKLLDHVKKATPLYGNQPLSDTLIDLDLYLEAETSKLLSRKRETAVALLEDEVDACKLLIERVIESAQGNTFGFTHLESLINTLFGDDLDRRAVITLSSVHKSKGREWPRVFVLGGGNKSGEYMPFHRATLPWELVQEANLMYVAKTRAERELYYVTGVQSAIDKGHHREAPLALPSSTSTHETLQIMDR